MKTLIFNGSPKEKGNTAFLIRELSKHLPGEITVISAYKHHVKACCDCGGCTNTGECVITDGMGELYKLIEAAENIVIASPIYFCGLTGPLCSMLSRLQAFYFKKQLYSHHKSSKTGIVILCGGGSGGAKHAEAQAKAFLYAMNAPVVYKAFSLNTDALPASEDEAVIKQIRFIGERLS